MAFLLNLVRSETKLKRPHKSTPPLVTYKTSLDTTPPPKSLSLRCKQINRVKNEVAGQSSSLFACMQVSDYKIAFTPMNLVFLELETHHFFLNCKLIDERNNVIIRKKFYKLLNKNCEYR